VGEVWGGGGRRDHRNPPQKQVQNGGAQHLRNGQKLASADHFANVEHRRVQLASVFRSPSHDGGLGFLVGMLGGVGWKRRAGGGAFCFTLLQESQRSSLEGSLIGDQG
jgi:hypothetical protein